MKRKYLAIAIIVLILTVIVFVVRGKKDESPAVNDAKSASKEESGKDKEAGQSEEGKDGHGHEEEGKDEHGHEEEAAEGSIEMDQEKIQLSKIKTATVTEGTVAIQKTFTGEVKLNEDRLARVIPRFSGVVIDVNVSVGKAVSQGQTLMLIESNESLTTYEVKSPISGVVIEKNVVVGAKADTDTQSFVVADLNTVWVEINVYATDLSYIKKGQNVTITSQGSNKSAKSTIGYVGPIINGQTRTASARVILDNKSGDWLPGMYISASVSSDIEETGVVIPDSAVQTIEGKPNVFVKTEKGFRAQEIKQGKSDGTNIQILSGVKSGEIIATENSFILKAELGKGEAEHSHD